MRLRGVYNYTEAVLKEPSAKVDFARLNWISGCVVKRTERFGKDLKLYADASGDRVDSSGKTVKFGKEKTSVKTIASPKIGKTYKLVTNFKYYYGLSTLGNIHGSVTYQLSHNGKPIIKYLIYLIKVRVGCKQRNLSCRNSYILTVLRSIFEIGKIY